MMLGAAVYDARLVQRVVDFPGLHWILGGDFFEVACVRY